MSHLAAALGNVLLMLCGSLISCIMWISHQSCMAELQKGIILGLHDEYVKPLHSSVESLYVALQVCRAEVHNETIKIFYDQYQLLFPP